MNQELALQLKQVIEDLEWYVSKRKGSKSVTFDRGVFSQKLERLIEIHDQLNN